ncbi:SRPBCC family protein [Intrasporangium sp. YIM S08009]|uniref:SRPBCC family protein n=1 Tax=Intrasporangium zincisolvens TaxID=3080018 RepID=UPI002B05B583|nr:SRPBCC family protein [Intrasporangium sp. YIM S08009]
MTAFAWQRTRSQHVAAPAAAVWDVVSDLRRWPEWATSIGKVEAPEQLSPGSTARYLPAARWAAELHGRTAPPLRVVDVETGRRLVVEQPNPVGAMRVEWTVEAAGEAACTVTQRVTCTGPLSPLVVRGVAGPLARQWPESVTRLAVLAGVHPSPDALRVVVAGGSGTLGRALSADLACRGHEVVVLTRSPQADLPHRQLTWDGETVGPWAEVLREEPARTAVVNLAGRLVDVRPTAANVRDLRESRVRPTLALVEASRSLPSPLAAWVQGSTTAIWSDAGETLVTESTPLPTGTDALPQMTGVARPWEDATDGANASRLVLLRTSIVLQDGSPAFDRLAGLTKLGLGGRVGSGRQWFSWVHVDDWFAIVRRALGVDNGPSPDGVVIAAAPEPVRNADLMASLRHHLRRPASPPTPELLVRVGSVPLRTDPALGLTGRHCTSASLEASGFAFAHPAIDGALADLLS